MTTPTSPVKLCADASRRNGRTSIGYVFKNHNGKITGKNCRVLGDWDINDAEYQAVLEGLEELPSDARHVIVYTDSDHVNRRLGRVLNRPEPITRIGEKLHDEFDSVRVEEIHRSENEYAHLEAARALGVLKNV